MSNIKEQKPLKFYSSPVECNEMKNEDKPCSSQDKGKEKEKEETKKITNKVIVAQASPKVLKLNEFIIEKLGNFIKFLASLKHLVYKPEMLNTLINSLAEIQVQKDIIAIRGFISINLCPYRLEPETAVNVFINRYEIKTKEPLSEEVLDKFKRYIQMFIELVEQ